MVGKAEGIADDLVSVGDASRAVQAQLKEMGVDNPSLEARLLVSYAAGIPFERLPFTPGATLEPEMLESLLTRRRKGEPVSRLVGTRGFWRHVFRISLATLDPRADSETLIELFLEENPEKTKKMEILDLGTGSGCLLLSLLKEYPEAYGTGTDIEKEALDVARRNAEDLEIFGRTAFSHGSWFEAIRSDSRFDFVIGNPPYIRTGEIKTLEPEVRNYDPVKALDGGADGLAAYRAIFRDVERFLKPGGKVFLEIGQGQEKDVESLAENRNFVLKGAKKDLGGIIRTLCFVKKEV